MVSFGTKIRKNAHFDAALQSKGLTCAACHVRNNTFRYVETVDRAGLRLRAEVIVYPDEFYSQFYEAQLAGQLATVERQRLSRALEETRKAVYKLFEKDIVL